MGLQSVTQALAVSNARADVPPALNLKQGTKQTILLEISWSGPCIIVNSTLG